MRRGKGNCWKMNRGKLNSQGRSDQVSRSGKRSYWLTGTFLSRVTTSLSLTQGMLVAMPKLEGSIQMCVLGKAQNKATVKLQSYCST